MNNHSGLAVSSLPPDSALYLQRLGHAEPPPPTLETLSALQSRHTATFVFETIANLTRSNVPLDLGSLRRKLLREGRGGYCFELNRLFLSLLCELGFDARPVAARVLMGATQGEVPARSHLAGLVMLDGVQYLTDVGFGGMVPTAPLRLDVWGPQPTMHEPYRIDQKDDGYLLHARVIDEWRALYLFDLQPHPEIDQTVGNWYVSTHPESPFRDQLLVARTGPGMRMTLNNTSFAVHRLGEPSVRRELDSVGAVIEVLEKEFGLRLPPDNAVRDALARKFDS